MASIQHVYRRGAIYCWRRTHVLGDKSRVEVRLSLQTASPKEARLRSAALAAGTAGVLELMEDYPFKDPTACPTMDELKQMTRVAYGEILARLVQEQRSKPYRAAEFSLSNRTSADVYGYLHSNGGKREVTKVDEANLVAKGWDDVRIKRLREKLEDIDQGNYPISRRTLDFHLRERGYWPHNGLRQMVLSEFFPAYRDACLDAEAELQSSLNGTVGTYRQANLRPTNVVGEAQRAATQKQQSVEASSHPERTASITVQPASPWLTMTPTQVAEAFIAETIGLLKHREGGKRSARQVAPKTETQLRRAAKLLELSQCPGFALADLTREHLIKLDAFFEELPRSYGKNQEDKEPNDTLAKAVERTKQRFAEGKVLQKDIGFAPGTTARHFRMIHQIHSHLRENANEVQELNFSRFTKSPPKDDRDDKDRFSVEQGRAIFSLPPWTGCREISAAGDGGTDRVEKGEAVYHDAAYFVFILAWYTGARREEICKLLLDDVVIDHPIPHIQVRETSTGTVKTATSKRDIPLADEVIRLGFIDYIEALRAEGETLVFPELRSLGSTAPFGDVFYKRVYQRIAKRIPDLTQQQSMHSTRHAFSDELKQAGVGLETRNDLMGHKNPGEGAGRYSSATKLETMLQAVNILPKVTDQLPAPKEIRLLPARIRKGREARPDRVKARNGKTAA